MSAVGRIDVPKASDLLAERIREQILSGTFVEGQLLPTERELSQQTGLGRSSIREALRILENQRLIATRVGRNGGSLVRRPDRSSVESSLALFIRGQQLRLASLLETREAIEPVAARLAAVHRNDHDLDLLIVQGAQLESVIDDSAAFLAANVQWHLAVVGASHNELLITFMNAIARAVHAGTEIDKFDAPQVRRATMEIHQRIFAAIRDGDPDAAERRMRRHVRAMIETAGVPLTSSPLPEIKVVARRKKGRKR